MNARNRLGSRRRRAGAGGSRGAGGFTMVELVITLAVIAILASIAIVNYLGFRQRAKTVEARLALHNIWELEQTYQKDASTYAADLTELGFHMIGTMRYTYTLQADATSFTARAEANLDEDAKLDVWEIYSSEIDPVHLSVD